MASTAGYATQRAIIDRLLTVPADKRERKLRGWLSNEDGKREENIINILALASLRELN